MWQILSRFCIDVDDSKTTSKAFLSHWLKQVCFNLLKFQNTLPSRHYCKRKLSEICTEPSKMVDTKKWEHLQGSCLWWKLWNRFVWVHGLQISSIWTLFLNRCASDAPPSSCNFLYFFLFPTSNLDALFGSTVICANKHEMMMLENIKRRRQIMRKNDWRKKLAWQVFGAYCQRDCVKWS